MKEFELVIKKIDEIQPDPDQPRKVFDQEKIDNMAKSVKAQGVINPIEIDENNIIITGEMRWRSAKEAGLKEVQCKVFEGMNKWERLERQTIENLHHNLFSSEEKENVISELWESGRYKTQEQLGKKVGLKQTTIAQNILAKKLREKKKLAANISTRSLYDISRAPQEDQEQLITKVSSGEIKPSEIRSYVSMLQEAPKDLKTEILKPDSEITLEEAIDISQVQDPDMRKESIKFIKKQKRDQDLTREYVGEIARGEKEPYKKVVDIDQRIVNQFQEFKNKVFIKMRKGFVKSYPNQVQVILEKIIREIQEFLYIEWGERTQVIEVQPSGRDTIGIEYDEGGERE